MAVLTSGKGGGLPGATVRGVARIANGSASNVGEGEVLVTRMTDINMLDGMRRARAVVTDQGGLLCHAAIVCTEMQKPYIIATDNATKVIDDGTEVEVDVDSGEVRD